MTSVTDRDLQSIVQHDKYYIPGGDLCFQVEHVSFRVHKYFFERDSSYFAARLNTPTSPGVKPQGSTDATAIVLDEVTHEQFAKLLWVFYNPYVRVALITVLLELTIVTRRLLLVGFLSLYSIYEAPYSTWADILRMASIWCFHGVKELAIRELENKVLPDVDRIRLYLDNGVDGNLLVPCYAALCEREKPLTLEEGRILGMEVALQIAAGREQVRATIAANGQRSPLTPTVRGKDLHGLIRELFEINSPPASPALGENEDPLRTAKPAAGGLTPLSAPPRARVTPPPPPPKLETSTPQVDSSKPAEPGTPAKVQPAKRNKKKVQAQPQTPHPKTTASNIQEETERKTSEEASKVNDPLKPAPVPPTSETVETSSPDPVVSSPPPPLPPKLDASNSPAPPEPPLDASLGPDSIPSSLLDSQNPSGSTGSFPTEPPTNAPTIPLPSDPETKDPHHDITEPAANGNGDDKPTPSDHLLDIVTPAPLDFQLDGPKSPGLKGAAESFWQAFTK